ncbi:hypothetical protein [Staphylococcus lutrae]|nr:hypothetical protein [Staphylococcus lutrae]
MILIILFNGLALAFTKAWSEVPVTIYVVLVAWFISCLVIMKQDSVKNIKVDELVTLRYLIVNLVVAYMQPVAFSTGYVIGNAYTFWNTLDDWLIIQVPIVISCVSTVLFSLNEFHLAVKRAKTRLNIIAVLLKLISFILIIYFTFKVPSVGEEYTYIWTLVVLIIPIDGYVLRSFFYYGLYIRTHRGEFDSSNIEQSDEE